MDVMKALYKEGGLASVNRGFCATMLRDGVASAFYFSTYEVWKCGSRYYLVTFVRKVLKSKLAPKDSSSTQQAVGTFFAGMAKGIAMGVITEWIWLDKAVLRAWLIGSLRFPLTLPRRSYR